MAKKKYEFKPDKVASDWLGKLYLTKKQRLSLLKWSLFGLILLVLSLVQDVVLCRMRILGATTDLVPWGILLICLMLDVEVGAVFSLVSASLYQFSGTAPGYHVMVLIPVVCLCASVFRQSFLRRSFSAVFLCGTVGLFLYEAAVFMISALLGQAPWNRVGVMAVGVVLTAVTVPAIYPLASAVSRIGGEAWKD